MITQGCRKHGLYLWDVREPGKDLEREVTGTGFCFRKIPLSEYRLKWGHMGGRKAKLEVQTKANGRNVCDKVFHFLLIATCGKINILYYDQHTWNMCTHKVKLITKQYLSLLWLNSNIFHFIPKNAVTAHPLNWFHSGP